MNNIQRKTTIGAIATAVAFAVCPAVSGAPPTDITELVLYGIDADTHELLRYVFGKDEFTRIGVVADQNGFAIDQPECLTYVPSGPDKGFYTSPMGKDGTGGPKNVLAKINGMTGKAFMYSTPFTYTDLRGMVTIPDGAGGWIIYAVAHNNFDTKLVELNPADGSQTWVVDLDANALADAAAGFSGEFEGLAVHPTDPDKLYIMSGYKLAELDISSGAVNEVADHQIWARTESLELMTGDNGLAITVPGVDVSWTQEGALFAFSDNLDMMLIYDGGRSNFVEYSCSFVTVDCEGLVFMTQSQDPFGMITVDAHD